MIGHVLNRGTYTVSGTRFDVTLTSLDGTPYVLSGSRAADGTLKMESLGTWLPVSVDDIHIAKCT